MNTESSVLETRELVVGYQGSALLPPLSFSVQPGEFWALIGSNGSGKSTILKSILGLQKHLGGTVERVPAHIGFVPQRAYFDASIPARARDVVLAGALNQWNFLNPFYLRSKRDELINVAEATKCQPLLDQQVSALSEGQRQRVLLARALINGPHLLVLDEPTSAMDHQTERELLQLLEKIRAERGIAIVMVSHNLSLMAEFATHALMLDRERQLLIQGDLRSVADNEICLEHFGLSFKRFVDERSELDQ